jgi:hypothetical protein
VIAPEDEFVAAQAMRGLQACEMKPTFFEELKYCARVRNFERIPADPIYEVSPEGHASALVHFEYLKRPATQQSANESGSVEP